MNVLFATDGSAEATHAIREGVRLLALKDARVYVVGVVNPMGAMPVYDGLSAGGMLLAEKMVEVVETDLMAAVAVLADLGVHAQAIERQGDPASAIMEAAREVKADVIVLGSHGTGAVGRLILGSVCDRVTHAWPGAVLVVRPTHH